METIAFGDASQAVTVPDCAMRERYLFGPGAFIAPLTLTVQGSSVSGAAQQGTLAAMAVPAAVNDGTDSGQRLRRPPV